MKVCYSSITALIALLLLAAPSISHAKTYRLWNGKATVNLPAGVKVEILEHPNTEKQYSFTAKGSKSTLNIWISPLYGSEIRSSTATIYNSMWRGIGKYGQNILSKKIRGDDFSIKYSSGKNLALISAQRRGKIKVVSLIEENRSQWNSSALKKLRAVAASLKAK